MYDVNSKARDETYEQAVGLLVLTRRGSTAFLQRSLGVGYNAAARMMERAEAEGIIAAPNHIGARHVIVHPQFAVELRARMVAELEALSKTYALASPGSDEEFSGVMFGLKAAIDTLRKAENGSAVDAEMLKGEDQMGKDEAAIEAEIASKGLTASRVTPDMLDAEIVDEDYHIFPRTSLTVCCLTLKNGFTVTGESACASPQNFDAEIGRRIARANAREKIWPLLGFRLRDLLMS